MNIEKIVKDQRFIDEVDRQIDAVIHARKNRPAAPEGKINLWSFTILRYKRDWYDRFKESGQLTANYFVSNYESIYQKKSFLPTVERTVINYYCQKALMAYLITVEAKTE